MLEDTLTTFRGHDYSDISPAQGIMLVDGWLQALAGDPNLAAIKGGLTELHEELNDSHINPARVQNLLLNLADHTEAVASGPTAEGTWTGKLESISKLLRKLSNDLHS